MAGLDKLFDDDFRTPASQISERIIQSAPNRDPLRAEASLCWLVDADGAKRHSGAEMMSVVTLLLAILALPGGLALIAMGFAGNQVKEPMLVAAGGALAVFGVVGFGLILARQRGALKRQVYAVDSPHRDERWIVPPETELDTDSVQVEDAHTWEKVKLVTEDKAVLAYDPEHRRVLMEGLCGRYVIRADDVTEMRTTAHGSSQGVLLAYRVGREGGEQVELRLVLSQVSAGVSLAEGVGMSASERFRRKLAETFGFAI